MKTLVICILLGLSSLFSTQVVAKSLASKGAGAAQNWLEMTRIYQESSVFAFNEMLAALRMDVAEFSDRGRLHDDRLRRYMNGELFLDAMELDKIVFVFKDTQKLVRKYYGGSVMSLSTEARKLLYGVANGDKFRSYAQIEKDVHALAESGEEITPEQEQLVNKVNAIRNDAFARLEYAVTLADINYYRNKKQTSSDIFADILALLRLSTHEFAAQSHLDEGVRRIAAHQRGEIIFSEADMVNINAAIKQATIPQPMFKEQLLSLVHKSEDERKDVDKELRLKLLLQDFNDAVRVERYLRDPRRADD